MPACCCSCLGLIAGAGAAAAAAEVGGFFKLEMLRRLAMEVVQPWIMSFVTADRFKHQMTDQLTAGDGSSSGNQREGSSQSTYVTLLEPRLDAARGIAVGSFGNTTDVGQAWLEFCRPRYDAFSDFWDINRDIG